MIEFDSEGGILKSRWSNTRTFMFGSMGWSRLRSDLQAQYFEGGLSILQNLGLSFGQNLGTIGRRKGMDMRAFFDLIGALASSSGWGRAELSAGDPVSGRFVVRVVNCVFCSEMGRSEGPSCEFLAGVLKGFVDVLSAKEHLVDEVKCVASGNEACEFSLGERELE